MARPTSAFPVGTQFSPASIDLSAFLDLAIKANGDQEKLKANIWKAPVQVLRPGKKATRRGGSLPLEAAIQYGLLEKGTYKPTPLSKQLAKLKGNELYEAFARHILLNLKGLVFVETCQQMAKDASLTGLRMTGDTISRQLTLQGYRMGEHNTQINTMRMWLAKAGIFPEGRKNAWIVNEASKAGILGIDDEEIGAIVSWGAEERALAIALCRLDPRGRTPASQVRELADVIHGDPLSRASLPKLFKPLEEAGYVVIDVGKGTQSGKTAKIKTTHHFRKDVLEPFLTSEASRMNAGLLQLYKMDAEDIKDDLRSKDAFTKGVALEAYAVRVMRLLGLSFIDWRARARDFSGGAEVDVVLAGNLGGFPTRWQVQCKNTPSRPIRLEDVAREVGLAPLTKATHILMLANSTYTEEARNYALSAMESTALTIYLFDKDHFQRVLDSSGLELAGILREQGEAILRIHRQGLERLSSGKGK